MCPDLGRTRKAINARTPQSLYLPSSISSAILLALATFFSGGGPIPLEPSTTEAEHCGATATATTRDPVRSAAVGAVVVVEVIPPFSASFFAPFSIDSPGGQQPPLSLLTLFRMRPRAATWSPGRNGGGGTPGAPGRIGKLL